MLPKDGHYADVEWSAYQKLITRDEWMETTDRSVRARSFLSGEALKLDEAMALWQQLQARDQISTARAVLARIREEGALLRIRDVSNYDFREMYCRDGDAPGAMLAALAKSPRSLPCEQQRPSLRSDA